MRPPDVVLQPIDPPGSPVGFSLLGDSKRSDFSSGGYSFTAVPRSRRQPYIEFTSELLAQLELPLMLDGSDDDTSIDPAMAVVHSWRRAAPQTGKGTVVSVDGPVNSAGYGGWVVMSVSETEAIRRHGDGARIQQTLTLTLLAYPDASNPSIVSPADTAAAQVPYPFNLLPPQLQALASQYTPQLAALAQQFSPQLSALQQFVASHGADLSRLANAVPQLQTEVQRELAQLAATLPTVLAGLPRVVGSHRTTIVRPGDNLLTIANREYGDYRKWTAIALVNHRRDPDQVAWGERILLPG